MDNAFEVPGLGVRFGLDGLIGLRPARGRDQRGDLAVHRVRGPSLGATRGQLTRMVGNILIDTAAGAIPVLGDLVDIGFKANVRNRGSWGSMLGRVAALNGCSDGIATDHPDGPR